MPHVTGHFCVCHVELWLLFHDFFPVPGYLDLDLVPGYLGTWVPRRQKIKNPDYATMWIIFCDNVDYDNVDYATMWIINPHCRNPHF